MRKWVASLSVVLAAFLTTTPALAQLSTAGADGSPQANVTAVDTNNFPEMFAYFTVLGADGAPVTGLEPDAIQVTEGGQPVANLTVREIELGVQVVFAIQTNPAFKTRDAAGNSRLDFLRTPITAFAGTPDGFRPDLDDITLLTPEKDLIIHGNARTPVVDALQRYTTEFLGPDDPSTLAARAIDIASDATPRPGMSRMVVLAVNDFEVGGTPVPVDTLVARAQAAGVRVSTVYVGPDGTQEGASAGALRDLAERTGGLHVYLTGFDSLDPIFADLAAQRLQYQLAYRSRLNETGQHQLAISAELPDGLTVRAPEMTFQLRVEAPSVEIGTLPDPLTADASGQAAIPFTLNFADGYPRALSQVELVVDGQVAAQQSDAVDQLLWAIPPGGETAERTLQLRIIDELGLAAESDPVTVPVAPPAVTAAAMEMSTASAELPTPVNPYAAAAAAAMAVAAVTAGIVIWRRRQADSAAPAGAQPETPPTPAMAAQPEPVAAPAPRPMTEPRSRKPVSIPNLLRNRPKPTPAAATTDDGAPDVEATQAMRPARAPWVARLKFTRPLPSLPGLPKVSMPRLARPGRPSAGADGVPDPAASPAPTPQPDLDPGLLNAHAVLEVIEAGGGAAPRSPIELNGVAVRFGRDPELAEVTFPDRSVSRLHARIEAISESDYKIYDEGSTSGTWVNYAQVAGPEGQPLKAGDVINLGRVQLRFRKSKA